MKPSHITSLQIYKIPFAGGGVYGAGGVGYGARGTGILNLKKRHSFSSKLLEAYKASRHRGHHILTMPEKQKGKQKGSQWHKQEYSKTWKTKVLEITLPKRMKTQYPIHNLL